MTIRTTVSNVDESGKAESKPSSASSETAAFASGHPVSMRAGFNGRRARQPVLITGGAGFIGTNLAARLASEGHRVRVFDNLRRAGVEQNVDWLVDRFGDQIDVEIADVRNRRALASAAVDAKRIFHFAAQVAVTTSLESPRDDFEVNLQSTFALLDALRQMASPPPLLFTSTNKVYGNLDGISIDEGITPAAKLE